MIKKINGRQLWIVAGCFGWGLITLLSLLPAASMPRIGLGSAIEHWLAFAAVGSSFGIGFTSLRLQTISCFILTLGALVFELVQNFVPGRDPDIYDFIASSLGAWVGLVVAILGQAIFKAIRRYPG